MIRVESLHIFPLKSGAGRDTASARVETEGLADDRRMMVIDAADRCITARAAPALLTIRSELDRGTIVLSAPGRRPIAFRRSECRPFGRLVRVWSDPVEALDAGDVVAEWLGVVTGRPCRLALKGERTARPLSLGSGGLVSFADTAPLLLTTQSSLADLNSYLEDEVEMARFRPNLVLSGTQAWDEDGWGLVRIGHVEFEVAGPCDRCVMTTLDPWTGEARPDSEPLAGLGRRRRSAEDGKVYFGQFLIPRSPGRLFQGDMVEVLARKRPLALKPATARPAARLPSLAASPSGGKKERLLRCVAVIDETPDLRTFRFACDIPVAYRPGQFITLLLDIDGREVRRNYTLSSSPSRPHHLSISVKRGAAMSAWLHDNLKPGDTVKARGPNGRFHLAAAQGGTKLLMLSAGSGITPMMSMLRFIADSDMPLDVVFHHSARNAADLAFVDELMALRKQMGGRLMLSWNLTGETATAAQRLGEGALFEGRLNAAMLARACPDLGERTVFCCGPDGFRGLARQIHQDQSPQQPFLEESFGGEAIERPEIGEWRVDFTKSGIAVAGRGTVTLLELARRQDVSIEADCEAGICGTCRCRVVTGAWRVAANSADTERSVLSPDEQAQGYVLACSTSPIGPVEVEL